MVSELPIGARVLPKGVRFRLWAGKHESVTVVIEESSGPGGERIQAGLLDEGGGYFSAVIDEASAGDLYRFQLDGETRLLPDPASRFQPQGPHGPSQVIDPSRFDWTDQQWPGVIIKGQVIYEMHIGTYTPEGTWQAASRELRELKKLGVTVVELMPVADFPGQFGWGYDGVNLFAPTRLYGSPDDFRSFVDQAHALGLAVILDVVYNHLGPDGNYLTEFSDAYLTDKYQNEWGRAINFDGEWSAPVREFFVTNAGYWVEEFHLDGLRLDATQSIYDSSPEHILAAFNRRVREVSPNRSTIIIAENEPQNTSLIRRLEQGGYGLDAVWNDDFHHTALVALTGHHEAYYSDYRGTPQEFLSALKWGYLYQGQYYTWQNQLRGKPTFGIDPSRFILFIQNHDQVANSGRGLRCQQITSPGLYRAVTALFLLAPGTPMLFQGQEFAASHPFLYFADLPPELAEKVHEGRLAFLSQFPSLADPAMRESIADANDRNTFERSKLDLSERSSHHAAYNLHQDLLKLRREDPVLQAQGAGGFDGAVLGGSAFLLRYFGPEANDRLLICNLGSDLHLLPQPEPLLAPPEGKVWEVIWSSEHYRYGGSGVMTLSREKEWVSPGQSTSVLRAAIKKGNHG